MSRLTPLGAQAAIAEVHLRSADKVQALIERGNNLETLRDFVVRIETNPCEATPETKKCDKNTYRVGYTGLHIVQAEDATTIGFRDQNGEVHAITMPRDKASETLYSSWSIDALQDNEDDEGDALPALPTPSYLGIAEMHERSDLLLDADIQKTITTALGHICGAIEMADAIPRPRAPIMELDPTSFTLECLRLAGSLQLDVPPLSAANSQEPINPALLHAENIPGFDRARVLVTA